MKTFHVYALLVLELLIVVGLGYVGCQLRQNVAEARQLKAAIREATHAITGGEPLVPLP